MDRNLNINQMKKSIVIITLLIISISCKEKLEEDKKNIKKIENMDNLNNAPYNTSELGDGLKYNYDALSLDYINKVKTSLTNRNFKFLDKEQFREKILEVFNFNIDDYKNNIIVLRPAMFTEIAIKNQNFILIEDSETDDRESINSDLEYYYNSYVFHNDKISFNWLKFNEKEVLNNLVIEYGYNKDKELVKFVFKDFDFDNKTLFHNLIFNRELKTKKFKLREGILNDIENIVYGGNVYGYEEVKEGNGYNSISEIIETIRENSKQYIEPEKNIAFLYEKDLRIGIVGHIESNLNIDSNYKPFLKSNSYFGYPKLLEYVENIYGEDPNSEEIETRYKINDPDGYTNLRKEKNTTSSILEKVKTGESVEVIEQSGDWYLVKTKTGNKGYVYKTKIKVE